ncbi:MAG: hypothetical protein ACYC9Z_09005 [Casimicrobiaceae bacterium]
MPELRPLRLFLLAVHGGTAHSIERYLSSQPGLELAGVASSIAQAAPLFAAACPDIVLFDCAALGAGAVASTRVLKTQYPRLRLLALAPDPTMYRDWLVAAGVERVIAPGALGEALDALGTPGANGATP